MTIINTPHKYECCNALKRENPQPTTKTADSLPSDIISDLTQMEKQVREEEQEGGEKDALSLYIQPEKQLCKKEPLDYLAIFQKKLSQPLSDARPLISFLPSEILLHIFCYLGAVDLCRCALVCANWDVISKDESLWKVLYDNDLVKNKSISQFSSLRKKLTQPTTPQMTWKDRYSHQVVPFSSFALSLSVSPSTESVEATEILCHYYIGGRKLSSLFESFAAQQNHVDVGYSPLAYDIETLKGHVSRIEGNAEDTLGLPVTIMRFGVLCINSNVSNEGEKAPSTKICVLVENNDDHISWIFPFQTYVFRREEYIRAFKDTINSLQLLLSLSERYRRTFVTDDEELLSDTIVAHHTSHKLLKKKGKKKEEQVAIQNTKQLHKKSKEKENKEKKFKHDLIKKEGLQAKMEIIYTPTSSYPTRHQ